MGADEDLELPTEVDTYGCATYPAKQPQTPDSGIYDLAGDWLPEGLLRIAPEYVLELAGRPDTKTHSLGFVACPLLL